MALPIADLGTIGMRTTLKADDVADGLLITSEISDAQLGRTLRTCQDEAETFSKFGDGLRVASIPKILIDEFYYRTGINLLTEGHNHEQLIKDLLNGDWKPFKTIPGNV